MGLDDSLCVENARVISLSGFIMRLDLIGMVGIGVKLIRGILYGRCVDFLGW